MRVSYNWLKDYVDFDLSPAELAEKLTMAGLEVEEIIPLLPKFDGIVVGYVKEVNQHPNADKLSLCSVETGSEDFQVICGAQNVAKGQNIAFAPIGTKLPNGLMIKKAKIRGVESFGMICSEQELGLADHSDDIWELPEGLRLGEDLYEQLAPEQDYVLDIAVTPNRSDALSMIGVARDVAAIVNSKIRKPDIHKKEGSEKASDAINVTIENPDGCPRYAARVIRNIKIGPSPEWMVKKLIAGGIRPINVIVDITNFVLLELGQPLHAFDLSNVEGSEIIVRDSKPGEKFITLDEKERILPENTVLICDAERSVAIGGIMGGLNSEVSDRTTDVLLESAYFTPARIGAASKRLNLSSEASQRFERGVDPNGVLYACDRAAFLMAELAGGEVLHGIVDKYPVKINNKKVKVRTERVNHLLGTKLTDDTITDIFRRLGINYSNGEADIPTFRPDLEREVDMIEEVARMITFDKIPLREQTFLEYDIPINREDILYQFLKEETRGIGFYEVITNSMISLKEMESIDKAEYVKILNPVSDDMNIMRRSLLPGLLKAAAYNINRNMSDLRLFEIGRVFLNSHVDSGENQPYLLSAIIHGNRRIANWSENGLAVDYYDIKGCVETFFNKIFLDKVEFILYDKNVYFDINQAVSVHIKNKMIGRFGKINSDITRHLGIDSDVFGFEFSVDEFKKYVDLNQLFEVYSRYPFVEKDLSLIVDNDVQAGDLRQLIYESGKPLVHQVDIFDLFKGEKLGETKKSIAFRIRFQSSDRTLNEKEVSKVFKKIISDAEYKFNANLRD